MNCAGACLLAQIKVATRDVIAVRRLGVCFKICALKTQ